MKRRQLLLGIGATVGAGAALSSGAFSNVSADRQLAVTVADDAAGLLSLAPTAGSNGEYVDDSGDRVTVQLGDSTAGLTEAARYEFDSTLHVGNQGTQSVYVWAELSSAAFAADELWAYPGDTTTTPLNAANPVELGVGGGLDVGFYVDTSSVDTDTYSPTITLHASDEPPKGGEQPPEEPPEEPTEFVDELVFDSTSSLLAAGTGGDEFGYLPAERVVVAAEATAASTDADGNGDAVSYPDGEALPLVAADGSVVAFGFPFAQDAVTFGPYGNEEVLLNVLDEYAGSGTVLWDEGHGQYYDLGSHSSFAGYAGENGYTVEATSDVLVDLPSADAVVVTSPSDSFSDAEVDALSSFADDGGLVVLMDQSDYSDYDQTAALNDLAAGVGTTIRFNDNQVVDDQRNDGANFVPVSSSFNTDDHASLLAAREGLGLDPAGEYEVDVVEVTDGDTMDVVIPDQDGIEETVRVVGIDTPETGSTDERIEEYEGITDEPALKDLADQATSYAEDHLAGETVTLSFDETEPARGDYGRLLGFLELPDGTVYNRQAVADGWARVYASGFGDHDDYWDAEDAAQADGKGIWSISDPASVPESGDDPVDSLFFPSPVAVQGGSTVVASENGDPLVAVDESAGVAAVGGPLVDEGFEPAEGGDPSNDGQQVYPFLANLIDYLADGAIAGPVLFDGGHGQFDSDFGLSGEDVAYFQRYLEGQSTAAVDSIPLEGTNDLTDDAGPALLDDAGDPAASALVVTAPVDEFTADERAAVADFADAGGAVVLVGTARDDDALANFEDVVADLGASVGFTGTAVTDGSNNLGGEPSLPTTTSFPGPAELFTAFTPEDGGGGGSPAGVEIAGLDDSDEWVAFENTGAAAVDVTGWTLSDETAKTYTFPSTTLAPGETFVVTTNQTPSGAAPAADYTDNWDEGYVWNSGGDTATLSDADGTVVDTYSY